MNYIGPLDLAPIHITDHFSGEELNSSRKFMSKRETRF